MLKKILILCVTFAVIIFVSCERNATSKDDNNEEDSLSVDSTEVFGEDSEEESIMDAMSTSPHLDEVFNDFLFTFVHSHALQRQRIEFPLRKICADGSETKINKKDWRETFSFLKGEFYTSLYTRPSELSYVSDTTVRNVSVDCILLKEGKTRCFDFTKNEGKWMLTEVKEVDFDDDDLEDFLSFYTKWSTDSTFREESIPKNLKISILDPDDDEQNIDGFIDREQFSSFCPDVPRDTLSNICYGQNYLGASRILLQKSGPSNGLQEMFTFEKDHRGWKLKKYEN